MLLAEGAPELSASAAILVEESTGTVLYDKNADQKMYPASMTKVLTALVALDYFKPEELIKVGYEINEISLDSSKA
ncbi:MAG: D-alanyl-D-alanine carboxypeptidase, partial [Anaerotignum sp.]|nr:D-alanyl-D-alanine carboxypeptidase [Anaerotignum sp.]